jgi:hypothetical protein
MLIQFVESQGINGINLLKRCAGQALTYAENEWQIIELESGNVITHGDDVARVIAEAWFLAYGSVENIVARSLESALLLDEIEHKQDG